MMNKNWHVIGLMSGTSLDGVDLVYVKISRNKGYGFEILQTESINYSEIWKNELKEAFAYSGRKLIKIDTDYGVFLGELVRKFILKNEIKNLDFIASHGHTIFHKPEENYTLQIGNGAHLAHAAQVKVICDFRIQDVAMGGQGAPLVPIGDQLLFSEYDMCLNIGGFANISYFDGSNRVAYDICPANIVLNHFTRIHGFDFDDKGMMASRGAENKDLLKELNDLAFYAMERPKSLGYEFVQDIVLPLIASYDITFDDVLRTLVAHMAFQISNEINKINMHSKNKGTNVLITGGGAYNDFMIDRIRYLSHADIVIPSKETIEFKEALIFALLGVLKDQEEVNCLSSVTGASKDHSGGIIYNV